LFGNTRIFEMTAQTAFQVVLFSGLVVSAIGGLGSYYFGKVEDAETQRKADETQHELKAQITKLQANFDAKTDLIFKALNVKQDVWTAVKIESIPPGVADYLLLLFKSDKGRISGEVRVQGSSNIAYFSTTTNDTLPVAVPNLWLPQEQQYKVPTVIEFAVTEKTTPDATLSIFTQGWVDRRGREPH
jgi:hypothetical protein